MTSITTARQQQQVMVKHPIWPMPKHIQIKGQDEYVKLASNFKFIAAYSIDKNNIQVPPILLNGMKRYEALLQNKLKLASSATTTNYELLLLKTVATISKANVHIKDKFESANKLPNIKTNYEYSIKLSNGKITIQATSVYGALYGMESLLQLVDPNTGTIIGSNIEVVDKPDYAWRGLMIPINLG